MSDRMLVLFAAQSVAMSARINSLTEQAVDDMRCRAEELLSAGEDLRNAVITFATQYELHKYDPFALKVLGEALERDVAVAMGAHPLRERRDIDG